MTINCNGYLLDLEMPVVMGVLNLTPDSFFDGKPNHTNISVLKDVEKMVVAGAKIIDIGGYSSRPNGSYVSEDEEKSRLFPMIQAIVKAFPDTIFSVDTFRSSIAKVAVGCGVSMINDISGGHLDVQMLPTIAALKVPYIMMHMRGNVAQMMEDTVYEDVCRDVLSYFAQSIVEARALGIDDIIVDPGFGFSKTLDQNYELMKGLDLFKSLAVPLMVGVSRKSMIYKLLDAVPATALNGTTALHMVALQKGAHILRTHDVQEAVECIKIYSKLL